MPSKKSAFALLCTLFAVLSSVETKEIDCPAHCRCSTGFTAVKCSGMDHFPVFDFSATVQTLDLSRGNIMEVEKGDLQAYKNLNRLDLRHNEIQSVSPGLFSEMKQLRELFIDGNPWSCDSSTLHVLQEELTTLLAKNSHLDNFDGGRIKCDGPINTRGMKPLHMKLYSRDEGQHFHKGRGARNHASRWVAVLCVVMPLLILLIALVVWIIRQKKYQFLLTLLQRKPLADPVDKMEAGKVDDKMFLNNSIKKRRRMSQGIPQSDIIKSDDEEVVDQAEYIKEKMKKQRRQSRGYGEEDPSSEEECMVEVNLNN